MNKFECIVNDLVEKRKQIEKDLILAEAKLYQLETNYLEEPSNILFGFNEYLNPTRHLQRKNIVSESIIK